MRPLISVIIPVYNVEPYLDACIESVIRQTYDNLEILLIDDGSTDRSGQMCDAYAKADDRVVVIHQQNRGQGAARNKCLDICKGELIAFVDSDDHASENYIETLYNALIENDSDISVCEACSYPDGGSFSFDPDKPFETVILNGDEALIDLFYLRHLGTTPWGKLFKRRLFSDVRFPESAVAHDDLGMMYRIYGLAHKVCYMSKVCYAYRLRSGSVIRSANAKSRYESVEFTGDMVRFAQTKSVAVRKAARHLWVLSAFLFLLPYIGNDDPEVAGLCVSAWRIIKDNRWSVIFDSHAKKKTRLACALSFLGIRFVKFAYSLSHWREMRASKN